MVRLVLEKFSVPVAIELSLPGSKGDLHIFVPSTISSLFAYSFMSKHNGDHPADNHSFLPTASQPSEDVWSVVPAPPPEIPQDMKLLHSCFLQCNIRDFYKWFISGSSQFIKNLHIQV
jgi:hypothetical protein